MKLTGPEAMPPPESDSRLPRSVEKFVPVPEPHLKSMPSVFARPMMDSMLSWTELMKHAEHCGLACTPTLNHTGELNATFLLDEQMRQLVAESIARRGRGEVAAFFAPADDRIRDAADQLAHGSFALRRVELAVKIFRGDYVCSSLRPGLGYFHIFLTEYRLPFIIADQCGALFPFNFIVWRNLTVGKHAAKFLAAFLPRLIRNEFAVQCHSCFCHFASAQAIEPPV